MFLRASPVLGFGAISGVGLQSFYALRFVPYIPPGPTETTEMTFDRNGRGNMERLSRPPAFLLQTWLVRLRKGAAKRVARLPVFQFQPAGFCEFNKATQV